MWAKVKWWLEIGLAEWGIIMVLFLTAFGSFGLGHLSIAEEGRPAVAVSIAPEAEIPRGMHVGGLILASKNGSVYHYPWCPGGSQIKLENQIWFASEEAAKKAGLSPSKNCEGLGVQK